MASAARLNGQLLQLLVAVLLAAMTTAVHAAAPPPEEPQRVREIFVPFEDLNVILESGVRRVFLTREQYEDLLARVPKTPKDAAPVGATILAAEYRGQVQPGRLRLTGTLQVEVLKDGLHRLPLTLNGVGVRSATIGDEPAALARTDDGQVWLLVEGRGRHKLTIELVAPLQTTAAEQSLNLQIPTPPNTRLHMVVPGDVEVKSGAAVARREVIDDATHLELLPPHGALSVVMSLNNRVAQAQQVVVSRSVIVDEVTQGYERLHARVSMNVLHGESDQFRFALPDGFQVSQVQSPQLAQWEVAAEGAQQILTVRLQQPANGKVAMNIALIKAAAALDDWQMPRLVPLDTAGQVAVVGLVTEQRLSAQQIAASGLITIDNAALTSSIPQSVFEAEPGAPTIRPIVTYYAPQADYGLSARFIKPLAQHQVVSNLLLTVADSQLALRGGFTVIPIAEKLFELRVRVPAGWHVRQVSAADGQPLAFERTDEERGAFIRVQLPGGAAPRSATQLYVDAVAVPDNWLNEWKQNSISFPAFVVRDAQQDSGAIAVVAGDDLVVRPDKLEGLTPLDRREMANYGLANVLTTLAYRYDRQPFNATLNIERRDPWITAQTYSFLKVLPDGLAAHYEVDFLVQQAGTRKLTLLLPANTPDSLAIRGLDGVQLKESGSELDGALRRWTVLLAERRRGRIRLAVDFQQRLETQEPKDLALPLIQADGVAFQSGHVAVEGSPELDVQIVTSARQVDIGELSDADYLPGRRLLGAYAFGRKKTDVRINVFRHPSYGLPSAIVERAELVSAVSTSGISQTVARYDLRTKASFLEIELPAGSSLWSALLDDQPTKPQRDDKRLLLSLPTKATSALRKLQVVYETPSARMRLMGNLDLAAPKLYLRAAPDSPRVEVPVADVRWYLNLPAGYRVAQSGGTVFTEQVRQRPSPLAAVVRAAYFLAGGANPFYMHLASQSARDEATIVLSDQSESMRQSTGRSYPSTSYDGDSRADVFEVPSSDVSEPVPPAMLEPPTDPAGSTTTGGDEGSTDGATSDEAAENAPAEPEPHTDDLFGKPADGVAAGPVPGKPPAGGKPGRAKHGVKSKLHWMNSRGWALEGVSSLKIDVQQSDDDILFQSLGVDPQLQATLINDRRVRSLGWAVGLIVLLVGLLLTRRPLQTRIRYIVAVVLISTLLPLLTGWTNQFGDSFDLAFFAACALIPYYLLVGFLRWCARSLFGTRSRPAIAAAATSLLLVTALPTIVQAQLAPPGAQTWQPPVVVQIAPPPAPVTVPRDAIIVPYTPAGDKPIQESIAAARKVMVPYDKYVELWNQAHPDKKIDTAKPIASYALAGGDYSANLEGDEFLMVRGHLNIDLFVDAAVSIPFVLQGGVLTEARLDDQPARLQFVEPRPQQNDKNPAPPSQGRRNPAMKQAAPVPNQSAGPQQIKVPPELLVVLHARGKGRHRLDLSIRLPLTRRGGWRLVSGTIPAAPALALALRIPQTQTEVRLPSVSDRNNFETTRADETIDTVLGSGGLLRVEWRPQVAEGAIDRSLTATSEAVFDVREDSLQLMWQLRVDFGRTERESFTIAVPADYLIEGISGDNVRGWKPKAGNDGQQVEITLLKASDGQQDVTVRLARHDAIGQQPLAEFDVPNVTVVDAALHRGSLTVRRSPILEMRTIQRTNVTRTDASAEAAAGLAAAVGAQESPLGVRPYEAYGFVTTPFTVRLSAEQIVPETTAVVQSILRVSQQESELESLIRFRSQGRPVHHVRIALPIDMVLDVNNEVRAPEPFEWSVVDEDDRQLLHIYLGRGQFGEFPVSIRGSFEHGTADTVNPLPQLAVLDVASQEGGIVIQVDPAFDVRAENLQGCESVLPQRVYGWLVTPGQRAAARLALRYRTAEHSGSLRFTARQPRVTSRTITNVKITETTIEQTILLDFTIRDAGIRQVVFQLPVALRDARISAPELRQTTITPVPDQPLVQVQLDLQDDIMGQFGVKILADRLLTDEVHTAPIPDVTTGQTERRFVILENVGRDEIVVERQDGLEPLGRQQQQWRELATLLGNNLTQAYLVRKGMDAPQLDFQTRRRKAVETARAAIGLARAVLVVDGHGAYRGVQEFRLDNETEQFLEIELPSGASLWSASVAGASVKPITASAAATAGSVQIPLIKTAKGDRDYAVLLKYGGTLANFGNVRTLGFPLISTVNINVETSQVRLYLPETHNWFDFGGNMKKVEAGDLAAGEVAYNTKQINKFAEVLNSEDIYSKARAIANLDRVLEEQKALETRYRDFSGNKSLITNYDSNTRAADVVKKQLRDSNEEVAEEYDRRDNRGRLDEAWGNQRIDRASNVVKDIGPNFQYDDELSKLQHRGEAQGQGQGTGKVQGEGQGQMAGQGGGQRFNEKWLADNALTNKGTASKPGGGRYQAEPDAAKSPYAPGQPIPQTPSDRPTSGPPQAPTGRTVQQPVPPNVQPSLRPGESQQWRDTPGDGPGYPAQQQTEAVDTGVKGRARRYQQKLEQQQIAQAGELSDRVTAVGDQQVGLDNLREENGRPDDGDLDDAITASDFSGRTPALAGMASLDVEFPTRGRLYYFTTPRGNANVTARAISAPLLDRLLSLAWILGVVTVVLIAIRWIRHGGLKALSGRRGGMTLIALGVASLLTCILPVAGLLAIVIGVVTFFASRAARP